MQYVTWEQYSSLFGKISTEAEFERLLSKAQLKLDTITHLRIKRFEENYREEEATDFQQQVHAQIQSTLCEIIDMMSVQEETGMGNGIASVSNDGYSESYRVVTAQERESQLNAVIFGGLSGTGLAGAL